MSSADRTKLTLAKRPSTYSSYDAGTYTQVVFPIEVSWRGYDQFANKTLQLFTDLGRTNFYWETPALTHAFFGGGYFSSQQGKVGMSDLWLPRTGTPNKDLYYPPGTNIYNPFNTTDGNQNTHYVRLKQDSGVSSLDLYSPYGMYKTSLPYIWASGALVDGIDAGHYLGGMYGGDFFNPGYPEGGYNDVVSFYNYFDNNKIIYQYITELGKGFNDSASISMTMHAIKQYRRTFTPPATINTYLDLIDLNIAYSGPLLIENMNIHSGGQLRRLITGAGWAVPPITIFDFTDTSRHIYASIYRYDCDSVTITETYNGHQRIFTKTFLNLNYSGQGIIYTMHSGIIPP